MIDSKKFAKNKELFSYMWNDVGRRCTAKPENTYMIIANLSDFSATQISDFPSLVERTKMMLTCIGRFPLDIL